jgi:hypothetical protein
LNLPAFSVAQGHSRRQQVPAQLPDHCQALPALSGGNDAFATVSREIRVAHCANRLALEKSIAIINH